MIEVDIDSSGTVDFYEFLCVARMLSQGKGKELLVTTTIKGYFALINNHKTALLNDTTKIMCNWKCDHYSKYYKKHNFPVL